MDLHNPKVKRAMIEHVRFANEIVDESFKDTKSKDFQKAMRQVLVVTLLNFTLSQDWKLKNTLLELDEKNLPMGKSKEELTL